MVEYLLRTECYAGGSNPYSDLELDRIISYYSEPPLRRLLSSVSRCQRCREMGGLKRPLNLLCNDTFGSCGSSIAAEIKARQARYEALLAELRASGVTTVPEERFYRYMASQVLGCGAWDSFGGIGRGTSIGLHPWADFCMSHWRGPGCCCDIMVIGQDWYTVDQTLIDRSVFCSRYGQRSNFWNTFWNNLQEAQRKADGRTVPRDRQLDGHRFLFTNAMLCYRRGVGDSKKENFTPASITNCREHLAGQIEAFRPRLIIVCGTPAMKALSYVLRTLGHPRDDVEFLGLAFERMSGVVPPVTEWSSRFLDEKDFIGARFSSRGRGDLAVIPLYHPSAPGRPRWRHDYDLVAKALASLPSGPT